MYIYIYIYIYIYNVYNYYIIYYLKHKILPYKVNILFKHIPVQIHTGLQHSIIHAAQPNGLPLDLPTIARCSQASWLFHAYGGQMAPGVLQTGLYTTKERI